MNALDVLLLLQKELRDARRNLADLPNAEILAGIVITQLITLIPVGMAISIVPIEKTDTEIGPSPEANMW